MKLQLLGTPGLTLPDGSSRKLERMDASLLGLLAVEGELSRQHVARLLWPDVPLKGALNNLRQRLLRLKRQPQGALVVAKGSVLRLSDEVQHDLADLAAQIAADAGAARGELLAGIDLDDRDDHAQWLSQARAAWRARRVAVLIERADQLEQDNQFTQALPYAQRLLADDPTAEAAHRRLMRLHYRNGDRAAALAAYRQCAATLAAQFDNLAPTAPTRALAELIERSDVLDPAPTRLAGGTPPATSVTPAPTARTAATSHPAHLPAALLRPPSLVAREAEWQAIDRAWQRGQVVVLRGEPGIGKSRLAGDFARAKGGAPLCGARPGDQAVPYALLTRFLRLMVARHGPPAAAWVRQELAHWLPELGPVASAHAEAARLRHALDQALTDWVDAGWSAMVIDDVQFADPASLEALLGWSGQRAAAAAAAAATGTGTAAAHARLGWLFTVRSAEMPTALTDWLAAQPADVLHEIELAPLDHPALIALLSSLGLAEFAPHRWAAPLWRHTGGNPLYVLETLIAMRASDSASLDGPGRIALPSPQSVGRLIERRLLELPPDELRLARVAAIAGLDFDPELAATVLGCHVLDLSAQWAALETARVLRDGAFAHDLVYEATLRLVPPSIAQVIHRAVARELEARAALAGSGPAARIAEHWWAAQEWAAAAHQFERAAEAAASQARRDEEMRLLERAATAHDLAGDAGAALVVRLRGVDALVVVGSLAAAAERLDGLAPQAGTTRHQLAIALLRAKVHMTGYQAVQAHQAARMALDLATGLGDADGTFQACCLLASALGLQDQAGEALALLAAQAPQADAQVNWRSRCDFHATYGYVLAMDNQRRLAVFHYEQAVNLAEQAGDLSECLALMSNLAGILSQLGRVRQALPVLERAHRHRLRMGQVDGVPMVAHDLAVGLACTALGQYRRALSALESALQRARSSSGSTWIAAAEGLLANLYLTLGQSGRARHSLRELPPDTPVAQRARRLIVEARVDASQRRDGSGKLRQAIDLLAGKKRSVVDLLHAELALASMQPDAQDALAACRSVQARAADSELDALAMTASLREIQLLVQAGRASEAAALARPLVERTAQCLPADMHRGELWWIVFRSFEAAGDEQAARDTLHAAGDWLQTVLPEVPEAMRSSFLQLNPFNRSIAKALADRRG